MGDLGFVAAGYLTTAVALGAYVLRLMARARRARRRAAALAVRPVDRARPVG
jgi:hypothetical protein